MQLHKLTIKAGDLDAAQSAADHLGQSSASPALAVTVFESVAPSWVVDAYFDHAPALKDIEAELAGLGVDLGRPTLAVVPVVNWVALSQASLPPIVAGRFVVHGAHHRPRFALRRLAVEIEAGEAFGTGHNATTVLCLEALDVLVRRQRFACVLDLGCGTGVLAIAAARALPHARVLAGDNDPLALAIAKNNVRLNRVAQRIVTMRATGFDHRVLRRAQSLDLVLANILPGPLVALAPAMRNAVRVGGTAILCGLLSHQVREVAAMYRLAGFHVQRQRTRDGWTALVVVRRSARALSACGDAHCAAHSGKSLLAARKLAAAVYKITGRGTEENKHDPQV